MPCTSHLPYACLCWHVAYTGFRYTNNQAGRLLSTVFDTILFFFWKAAAKPVQSKTRASAEASFEGDTIEEAAQAAAKEVEKQVDGKLKRAVVRVKMRN
jgi:hypothetical protein